MADRAAGKPQLKHFKLPVKNKYERNGSGTVEHTASQ